MNSKFDPQAFPFSEPSGPQSHTWGMTLREYYIGQALAGASSYTCWEPVEAARFAVRAADEAMKLLETEYKVRKKC